MILEKEILYRGGGVNMQELATVQYGSIYLDGVMYDNVGFIFHTDIGLIKYGPLTGEYNIRDHFNKMLSKRHETAFDYNLLELDPFETDITIEEICTIMNYFILFKPRFEEVSSLFLEQDVKILKSCIASYQESVESYQKRTTNQ